MLGANGGKVSNGRPLSITLAIAGCPLATSACGSSTNSAGSAGSSDYAMAVKHAGCMRSHYPIPARPTNRSARRRST